MEPSPAGRLATAVTVAVALTLPTAVAYLYFVALAGPGWPNAARQGTYAAGKVVQFTLPVLYFALVVRAWPELRRPNRKGLLLGLVFGLLAAAVIVGGYHGGMHSTKMLAHAPARIRQKAEEFGVASPLGYVGMGVFFSVLHSFLEEYYWRWFVFGRLRALVPLWPAIVLSSLGFMAHHVIIIDAYAPGRFWSATVPASLGVAAGGAMWAWLYERSGGSLVAPWLSHGLIDAALFVVGWDLLGRAAG